MNNFTFSNTGVPLTPVYSNPIIIGGSDEKTKEEAAETNV